MPLASSAYLPGRDSNENAGGTLFGQPWIVTQSIAALETVFKFFGEIR